MQAFERKLMNGIAVTGINMTMSLKFFQKCPLGDHMWSHLELLGLHASLSPGAWDQTEIESNRGKRAGGWRVVEAVTRAFSSGHPSCLSQGRAGSELAAARSFQWEHSPGVSIQFHQSGPAEVPQRLLQRRRLRPQFPRSVPLAPHEGGRGPVIPSCRGRVCVPVNTLGPVKHSLARAPSI